MLILTPEWCTLSEKFAELQIGERTGSVNKAAVQWAIEILDTADANALVELAGLPGWGRSPVGRNNASVRQDLAISCCRCGILRVQDDDIVVALGRVSNPRTAGISSVR
jgi:hypothetical protein